MTTKNYLLAATLLAAFSAQAADLVVIANPAVGAVSKDQLSDLYLGKSVALTPYDQTEGSHAYIDFYKKATGRDAAQVKATWSRIVFSGKGTAPKQLADAVAMKKAVAADPKGVGYIDKSAVDASVKVVLPLE